MELGCGHRDIGAGLHGIFDLAAISVCERYFPFRHSHVHLVDQHAVVVTECASRQNRHSRRDGDIAMAIFASYVIGQFMPLFYPGTPGSDHFSFLLSAFQLLLWFTATASLETPMANPVDKEEDAPHKREEPMAISLAK